MLNLFCHKELLTEVMNGIYAFAAHWIYDSAIVGILLTDDIRMQNLNEL